MIKELTIDSAPQVLKIANAHELRVDEEFEAYPLSEMRQEFLGHGEPAVVFGAFNPELEAVMFIQTNTPRNWVDLDLFTDCERSAAKELLEHCIAWVKQQRPGFKIRSAGNKIDTELHELLAEAGFVHYRDYWKLIWRNLPNQIPNLKPGLEIRSVPFEENAALLHQLETDTFAEHFGYSEIGFDAWLAQRNSIESADPNGFFIAYFKNQPAGFLIADDSRLDQNGGWVDKLGVLSEYRGLGIGKALLLHAATYYSARGLDSVALGADTGNDSGALDLYFGLGFEPMLVWRAVQLPLLS